MMIPALLKHPSIKLTAVADADPAPLEHRKHVMLEKPMALSLTDADAMIAAVARHGVQLVVGHSHSFEPPIRKIREIVRSGELGGCEGSTAGIAPTGSTALGTPKSWTLGWAVG